MNKANIYTASINKSHLAFVRFNTGGRKRQDITRHLFYSVTSILHQSHVSSI